MATYKKYIEPFIVPDPVVEMLPVTPESFPLNMASHQEDPIELTAFDYVEEEYLVSGTANVYAWKDTTGRCAVRSEDCPYCTRVIVRKPRNPGKFSGNVMVEMMHGGMGIDNPNVGWGSAFEHILSSGDGYVGMSIAGTTFKALKTFDPARYARLSLPNPLPQEERKAAGNMASSPDQWEKNKCGAMPDDPTTEKGLDMDIMSQVSAMIKRGKPGTPFEGYHAERTYLIGVTFAEIPCYVSAVLPWSMLEEGKPIYDGAVIYMSGRAGNLNREEDILSWDDPRCKCGGPVPVVRLQTAGDIRGTIPHPLWACMFRSENSDEPGKLGRTYEVAGASLKYCTRRDPKVYPGSFELQKAGVDDKDHSQNTIGGGRPLSPGEAAAAAAGKPLPDPVVPDVTIMPRIITGIYRNLKDWSTDGIPLPKASYLAITGPYPDTDFIYDEHGNQTGGVRNPYVDVPVATYLDDGTIIPFSSEKLHSLYGSKENWLRLVRQKLEEMTEERWILPEDAKTMLEEAAGWELDFS